MIWLSLILIIILLIIFILIQTVEVRLTASNGIKIKLSFTILAISFYIKTKNKRKSGIRQVVTSTLFTIRVIGEIISRSAVKVLNYDFDSIPKDNSEIPRISLAILAPALLAYIRSRANSFEILDEPSDAPIDISFTLPFVSLFISLINSSYYRLKRKLGRS